MAATVKTYVYTGTSPGTGASATKLRFKLLDNNVIDSNGILRIPESGSVYSYWKSIALYAESAPSVSINNIKVYSDVFKLFGIAQDGDNLIAFDTGKPSELDHGDLLTLDRGYKGSQNGDYLYIVEWEDTQFSGVSIFIIDISDFTSPSLVNTVEVFRTNCDVGQAGQENSYDVLAYDSQYVLVLGGTLCFPGTANPRTSIWVLDVTDKQSVSVTENYFFNGYAYRHAGAIKDDVLYVCRPARALSGDNYFSTFDISSLPTVTNLGDISDDSVAEYGEVVVRSSSDHAYISLQKSDRVAYYDVSDPTDLTTRGGFSIDDPRGLALVDDDYLIICQESEDKISIYDVSTPMSPSLVTTLTDGTNLNGCAGVVWDGEKDYLYISCPSSDRLTVVDVSDIENPSVVNSITDATEYDLLYGLVGLSGRGLGWKNCFLYVGDETSSTYEQATGDSSSGDELVTNHSQISSKTSLFSYTNSSPKTVSGSVGASTGRISDFVVLQVEVQNGAVFGQKNEESLIWQYDEI